MTWTFEVADDGSEVRVWDHTRDATVDSPSITVTNPDAPGTVRDAQGVPVKPDVRAAILQELKDRGQVDLFALLTIAEALTGAGLEEVS